MQRGLVPSDNCCDFRRQLRDKITYLLKLGFPSDADVKQVYLGPDELAELLRVLVGILMPKIQKRYLADKALYACNNILKASRRENPKGCGIIPEVRAQSKNMLVIYHTLTMNAKLGHMSPDLTS